MGATATFDAFGALVSHVGTAVSRFGFTGNWTDPDTGLLYLRARDYDAATGQFLTVDPALDRTQQPYAYTGNNPVQRTDPTGLDWWSEAGDNMLAAGAGALSNLTMGASDAILGGMVPGYDCFISEHSDAYGIGDLMVTIVSVALMVIPGVGLVAAGLLIAKTAIRAAIKAGLRQTIRTATARVATQVRAAAARMADDTGSVSIGILLPALRSSPAGTAAVSDHVMLGVHEGLQEAAASIGARTLLKDANWQDELQSVVADSTSKISIRLDGLSGSSPYSQIMNAAQRGIAGVGTATDWEMGLLHMAQRLSSADLYLGGVRVANPFA